ncbi:hypothetical protein C5Y93_14455 [Blastopirellula marina]|uniref:Uncharacterized protein n=1 Tax=Blastopirellula marina TaxID=124 RepID=A0A2S8GNN6_9BACT|nr:hypothetical protein C5Y93_14455 [Blastopirellula marina]
MQGAEIRAWKKAQGEESYFVDAGNGKWQEMDASGRVQPFEEFSRQDDQVELIDRARNLKIRLLPTNAELSLNGNAYNPWINGEWIDRDSLPEFAQVAPVDHKVRLVYFIPTDREPTNNYREKIVTVMTFVNGMFQYEFRRRGLPARGLDFQTDDKGVPIVHVVRGKHPAKYYNGAPNYDDSIQLQTVLPEIPRKIGHETTHLVVTFMETYDSGPNAIEWPGGIARGGWRSADGGTANFSAWVLQDMFCATNVADQIKLFRDRTPIEGRVAAGHGKMNSPRSEFIEDGIGAVIHEVGHALGLPHDQRDPSHYLMGSGFRRIAVNLSRSAPVHRRMRFSDANARILAQSRLLNPKVDRTDNISPELEVDMEPTTEPNKYTVKLKATDNKGLKAVLYYDDIGMSVADGGDLAGTEDTAEIELDLQTDETTKQVRVHVSVIDQGGNITRQVATWPQS